MQSEEGGTCVHIFKTPKVEEQRKMKSIDIELYKY